MNCAASENAFTPADAKPRSWIASLSLDLQLRNAVTRVISSRHTGPLRVQRPFYPEAEDCCHVYLLHPPGGMAIGDELTVSASVGESASALVTTPSAGKVYGTKGATGAQRQNIHIDIAENGCLEWLPQETIIFNSANAQLKTRVNLHKDANYFGWEIVRLGRAASGEIFKEGYCQQSLEIFCDGKPVLIERNRVNASSEMQTQMWGLQNKNTFATLVATCVPGRELLDQLCETLDAFDPEAGDCWGLSQKKNVLIARYLGNDVALCRKGFELIWQQVRPSLNGKNAVPPRIWKT